MRDWHASVGGCTFAFRATYVPWLALAWVITIVSLIVLVVGVVRWRRQHSPLAGIGLTLVTMTIAGCNGTKPDDGFRANVVFSLLFDTCAVALVSGFLILVVSLILTLVHREMPWSRLAAGVVAMVMSLPTMTLAAMQIAELGREKLPMLDLRSPVGFHVGQQRHVKPHLFRPAELGEKSWFEDPSWTLDEVVFEATAPGVVERWATARSGRFTVSGRVKAKAHRAEGNPYLPLQVGNAWHYELTTTNKYDGTQYLLFFKTRGSTEVMTASVVLSIEAAAPRDGWREYTLVMKDVHGNTRGRPAVVRPVDGETYFYDPQWSSMAPDEPDPTATDVRKTLLVLLKVDPGATSVRECRLANIGWGKCQMGGAPEDVLPPAHEPPAKEAGDRSAKRALVRARVPTQYALAGPSQLTWSWKDADTLSSIVTIATFGSVSPGTVSGGEEYVLMRTVRGTGPP